MKNTIPVMIVYTIIISLILILTSCGGGSNPIIQTDSKPPIALYKIGGNEGLAKRPELLNEGQELSYDVDLDTIVTTSGFYFMLKNSGTSTITGLKFKSDKSYFKITPDSIVSLSVPTLETGMEQLIKVTVEHGSLSGGLGDTDVLTGDNYGVITITGTNADGEFSISYTMHVFAKRLVIYIDSPDTVFVDGTDYRLFSSLEEAKKHTAQQYVYTDDNSSDCYLSMLNHSDGLRTWGSNEVVVDQSTKTRFTSTRPMDNTYYNDGMKLTANDPGFRDTVGGGLQYDLSVLASRIYIRDMRMDMNCTVLVIDKIKNQQFILR